MCRGTTHKLSLPGNASIFTAELVAIKDALLFIESNDVPRHVVFSDSLSSLQALKGFYPTHAFIQDILTLLASLNSASKEVVLCWVPSHVNIAGNEKADQAARSAASDPPPRRFQLPASDFKSLISLCVRREWQRSWDLTRGNKLKMLKPKIVPWQSSHRKSRGEEVSLCRLRIGHTYATHRYLLCGEERPRCPRCAEVLTVRHVIESCRHLHDERLRFLGSGTLTLQDILGDNSCRISHLFRFLSSVQFQVIFSPGS